METISPVVFLNFFNCLKKYQNRDLATILSGEKILILYRGGFGSLSDGSLRPMTSYSFNWKSNFEWYSSFQITNSFNIINVKVWVLYEYTHVSLLLLHKTIPEPIAIKHGI